MPERLSPTGLSRLYYLHPAIAGMPQAWLEHFERARAMGFEAICLPPLYKHAESDPFLSIDHDEAAMGGSVEAAAARLAQDCKKAGLRLVVDVALDRIAAAHKLAQAFPDRYRKLNRSGALDPRASSGDGLVVSLNDDVEWFTQGWIERLSRLVQQGITGFRLLGIDALPVTALKAIVRGVPDAAHLAWTPGLDWPRLEALIDVGLAGVFASAPWWDGRAAWYAEEHERLRRIAPIIVPMEEPFGERIAARAATPDERSVLARHAARIAAATGNGWLMPMGFEHLATRRVDARSVPADLDGSVDISADIAALGKTCGRACELRGAMVSLSGAGARVSVLGRVDAADTRIAEAGVAIIINTDLAHGRSIAGVAAQPVLGRLASRQSVAALAPADVLVVMLEPVKPVIRPDAAGDVLAAVSAPRIVVENLSPSVAGDPAFAATRIVGNPVRVEADVYTDGHDLLRAELLWRAADEREWRRVPMALLGNDRWRASFTPLRIGRHEYAVEGWWDEFGSIRHAIEARHDAGVDVTADLADARAYLQMLADRRVPCTASKFAEVSGMLSAASSETMVKALLSAEMRTLVDTADPRAFAALSAPVALEIERREAGFASWYELFPRSLTSDERRSGTFDDVIAALPRIRAMGFDVLYFPPIHPIGTTNRKGRNNALKAEPDDLGSPYAIGSEEGGHDALHPALGTPQDFRRLVTEARAHGLELALDFAIQCSPDHPWLRDHPEWFRRRADGTIKYAENPPKKYQDIHNVDFYAPGAVPGLWLALRDVVQHWVDEGVRIFRVDNPHTKPLPFWQWMIEDIRGRHPDVMFLAEAFTRPTMMYRLAKVGFTQSYTYFTWRNTKRELTDYLTELTTTEVADFYRPNFFVNTPDINPVFLQTSGRPGFLIRAVLATTLSGLWGMYSGFELCEGAPLPGREEYLDSEKYQIRIRDFAAPGNIVSEIATLNRLRRAHPALQSHLGLRFYNAFNDQILFYGRFTETREDMILVAVNLDPHAVQEADVEIPLWEWKLPDSGSVEVEDLLTSRRFAWTGKTQHVRLDPKVMPYALWRIAPPGGGAS
jgi:starch synthase (maltosyl-transferring)